MRHPCPSPLLPPVLTLEMPRRENKLPLVGGHEGAGTIVALGEHTETDLKVGDKVGIKVRLLSKSTRLSELTWEVQWIAHSCNRCQFCTQGFEPLCKSALCSGCVSSLVPSTASPR